MTNYGEFFNTLLAICGAVSIIGGAGVVVLRWIRPALTMKERIDKLQDKQDELTSNMEELTNNTQCLLRCVVALLNSTINGDNIEGLKIVQNELNEFLIKK